MLKKYMVPFAMIPLLVLLVSCSTALNSHSEYVSSAIINQFPIPSNAKQIELIGNFSNPNIKVGVTYELKNIGGEQGLYQPEDYFQKLHEMNWVELEEKQMGHLHFFQKDNTNIVIEIKQDTFTIYELRSDTI